MFGRPRKNMFRNRAQERRRKICCLALGVAVLGVALFMLLAHNPGDITVDVAQTEVLHELEPEQPVQEAVTPAPDPVVEAVESVSPAQAVAALPTEPAGPVRDTVQGLIQRGDTAAKLLDPFFSSAQIHDLSRETKPVYSLSRMRAGRPYRIETVDGKLERFEYEINKESKLVIAKKDDWYEASKEAIVYDVEKHIVHGRVTSSLFGAVSDCGESPALGVRLADIFAWDIDFIRDIRVGDSFTAVVEKRYRNGEFSGYGRIEAAEYVNQGSSFKGFLFADKHGQEQYYDERGRSLRKAFLKAPLNFSRISSGFNLRRLHPVLKIRRPHPAIDYAAPRGTPVKTVGDGVVTAKGWDRGGGKYIKIRHNSVYETVYMHLKGFSKSLRKGKRVAQGQVIGYVGSTGMSTGPHLDFRMKKHGKYVNPRKIKSPSCEPVLKKRMADYMLIIQPLMAQLHSASQMKAEVDIRP